MSEVENIFLVKRILEKNDKCSKEDDCKKLESILEKIKNKELKLNEFMVYLYKLVLDGIEIHGLKEVLENNHIEQKIHEGIAKISEKIVLGEKLGIDEDEFLRCCLDSNILDKEEFVDGNIFRNILLKNKVVSLETFYAVVKFFVCSFMMDVNGDRIKNYQPYCEIIDFEKKGGSRYNFVILDKKTVDKMYEGDVFQFQSIFHELAHVKQDFDRVLGEFDEDILLQIKDKILREVFRKLDGDEFYYWNNYDVICSEKDAEIMSYQWLICFLENIGLGLDKNSLKMIDELIESEKLKKSNLLRKISSGEEFEVDYLLDLYIEPKHLKQYRSLTIEYIVDNGIVRRKTKKELLRTYMIYDNEKIERYIDKLLKNHKFFQSSSGIKK